MYKWAKHEPKLKKKMNKDWKPTDSPVKNVPVAVMSKQCYIDIFLDVKQLITIDF